MLKKKRSPKNRQKGFGTISFWKLEPFEPRIPEPLYLEPQVEQVVAEQVPQEELAVLLNFPPAEKAKADITR